MIMSCTGNFGMDIHVGDFVAYPGRGGSAIWMNCGVVIEINETNIKLARGIQYKTFDPNTNSEVLSQRYIRIVTLYNNHLVVKLDFNSTKYSDPQDAEYEIYQQIFNRLPAIQPGEENVRYEDDGC